MCDGNKFKKGCKLSQNHKGQVKRQRQTKKGKEPKVLKPPRLAMGPQQLGG